MAANETATLETRLAVVCYGGVSLAIYMSGITREIQELVTGSAVRLAGTRPTGTAGVYADLLDALEKAAADLDPVRVAAAGGGLLERIEKVRVHPGRAGRTGARETYRRSRHELLDLAGDAAHVDRERDAAVADDGQPRLERCGVVRSHYLPLTDGRGVSRRSR